MVLKIINTRFFSFNIFYNWIASTILYIDIHWFQYIKNSRSYIIPNTHNVGDKNLNNKIQQILLAKIIYYIICNVIKLFAKIVYFIFRSFVFLDNYRKVQLSTL